MRKTNQNKAQGGRQSLYPGANQAATGMISTDMVNCLKEELLETWEAYLIPDYHRTVFLDCIYELTPQ